MSKTAKPDAPEFRLYGRAQGKPLSARQQGLVDDLLPRIGLPESGPVDAAELLPHCRRQVLEIGFGGGEHLAAQAARAPDTGFIGIEPFLNGVAKALTYIDAQGLENVRLARADARELLPRFTDASLDRIFLLFPDPWHKKRHAKRRFVQQTTRNAFARLLKPGGQLRIATDVKSYADHCMSEFRQDDRFVWRASKADDWRIAPADHITTRYETKGLGDCAPVFMDWVRS
ncbi:MAG: tRNA (guanosine(46)-N7)-methyltransferase TrmB [Oceanicaulis sp.]|nr:tRNA (guanosine(46)-N7)-methyltransferase TrmB [Oceanicaulis sp.]MAZ91729.1 tRNA (guanosine(46)-N7)-methyltransferase TrmB [Maricaulis sp.]MBI75233.1 tRNA (guanosine(46)-N7)-methyltransferase TrmB [Oceanicaulis sp.]